MNDEGLLPHLIGEVRNTVSLLRARADEIENREDVDSHLKDQSEGLRVKSEDLEEAEAALRDADLLVPLLAMSATLSDETESPWELEVYPPEDSDEEPRVAVESGRYDNMEPVLDLPAPEFEDILNQYVRNRDHVEAFRNSEYLRERARPTDE